MSGALKVDIDSGVARDGFRGAGVAGKCSIVKPSGCIAVQSSPVLGIKVIQNKVPRLTKARCRSPVNLSRRW